MNRSRSPIHPQWLAALIALLLFAWPAYAWAGGDDEDEPGESEPYSKKKSRRGAAPAGDPDKERVEALVKLANRFHAVCESDETKIRTTTTKGNVEQEVSVSRAQCQKYCSVPDHDATEVDLCSFSRPSLARVAVAVAEDDIREVLDELSDLRRAGLDASALPKDQRTVFGQLLLELTDNIDKFLDTADAASGAASFGTALGIDVLQRLLGGLARVIEDRAKREAIGWMLNKVGDELCSSEIELKNDDQRAKLEEYVDQHKESGQPPAKTLSDAELIKRAWKFVQAGKDLPAEFGDWNHLPEQLVLHHELDQYWLGNLCALADEDRLDHYGAGAALLEALRGAIEADVRGWPGALAGLAIAELHWRIVDSSNDQSAALGCLGDDESPSCKEVEDLRAAGARYVARLLARGEPLDATRELASALSSASIRVTDQKKRSIENVPFALVGCGLSLPAELDYFTTRFAKSANPEYAALLAGLVRAPACWVLVGKSNDEDKLAINDPNIERLTTILRLHENIGGPIQGLVVEVVGLENAIAELELTLDREYPTKRERVAAQWQAGLAVIDASFSAANGLFMGLESLTEVHEVLPGLPDARRDESVEDLLGDGPALLADLRASIEIVARLGSGEFGEAMAMASQLLIEHTQGLCADASACRERADSLVRTVGTLAAMLEAETAEQVAEAIDAAANPPGGWRRKLAKGNFTVSLAAYAGTFGGGEWRKGPYGAVYERGKIYGQAPTLALPFGLDLVWGLANKSAFGVFVSIIDPAAFLHYDVSNDGRLPGPRPVTALAPGAQLRVNLGPTPLVLMFGFVYRPQFRAWNPTVSGPGADVIQFGGSLTVDVTLWKLFAKGK